MRTKIRFASVAAGWIVTVAQVSSAFANDYLKYQEPQPAAASVWSTLFYLFTLLVTFALVIALAYFASKFVGQKFGQPQVNHSKILSAFPLGPNKTVMIVEIAGKYLLLGVTEHQINLLQEITDQETIAQLKDSRTLPQNGPFEPNFARQLASLQQMSRKFPSVFGPRDDRPEQEEKR